MLRRIAGEKGSAETQWEAGTVIQEEMVVSDSIGAGVGCPPQRDRPTLRGDFYIGDRLCDEEKTMGWLQDAGLYTQKGEAALH